MITPENNTRQFHEKHNICTKRKLLKKKTRAQRKQVRCSEAQTGAQKRLLLRHRRAWHHPARQAQHLWWHPEVQEQSRGNSLKFGADTRHSHRGSGKAKATAKPFHISTIQANVK